MHKDLPIRRFVLALCLLVPLFGATGVRAQNGLDFSVLSENNPANALVLDDIYHAFYNGWQSIQTEKEYRWDTNIHKDKDGSWFYQNGVYLGYPNHSYTSYLVSPALNLDSISRKLLTADWSAGDVMGDIYLKMLIIDKTGKTLATLGAVKGVEGSRIKDWQTFKFLIPTLSGVGFVAFATHSDNCQVDFAHFNINKVKTIDGTVPVTVSVGTDSLRFSQTNVGDTTAAQTINVEIGNLDGLPTVSYIGEELENFIIDTDSITRNGGPIRVYFTPKYGGEKTVSIVISAGELTDTVTVTGTGYGLYKDEKPDKELLTNGKFDDYTRDNYDNIILSHWEYGNVRPYPEQARIYGDTLGYEVVYQTMLEGGAYLRQTIDITSEDTKMDAGDEMEGLIHYSVDGTNSDHPGGPVRLSVRWLDSEGNAIATPQDSLVNNPNLYFTTRRDEWCTLKFRATCPEGAARLEFGVKVDSLSTVHFAGFSARRLSHLSLTPLVAILPQYVSVNGEVNVPQTMKFVAQGSHLGTPGQPMFSGKEAANAFVTNPSSLPADSVITGTLTFTPQVKGDFTGNNAYSITFEGASEENSGALKIETYVKGEGTTPTIALDSAYTVEVMKTNANSSCTQRIHFKCTDLISNVNYSISQNINGPFKQTIYYSTDGTGEISAPENCFDVTFTPQTTGSFDAYLTVSSPLCQSLRIPLHGIGKEPDAKPIVERFTADQKLDSACTGKPWQGYHHFDTGYWRMNGTWNETGGVTLGKKDTLYYDKIILDGVDNVQFYPRNLLYNARIQYSIDGGASWAELLQENNRSWNAPGAITIISTHRPTMIRFVNKSNSTIKVDSISIQPADSSLRLKFNALEDAIVSKNFVHLEIVDFAENFSGNRNGRIIGLKNWRNLIIKGSHPFVAAQDSANGSANGVAKVSFQQNDVDTTAQETWLLSPEFSKVGFMVHSKSNVLTFSVRYDQPTDNIGEKASVNIISATYINANDRIYKAHALDLNTLLPDSVEMEPGQWYDFSLDLAQADTFGIDNQFHVAFGYCSPSAGPDAKGSLMVDNVTWGKTGLPVISADSSVGFRVEKGQDAATQTITISTTDATSPVTLAIAPASANDYFTLSTDTLPATGGTVDVTFHPNGVNGGSSAKPVFRAKPMRITDADGNYTASLLVQTHGAAPQAIRLRTNTPITSDIAEIADGGSVKVTVDGNTLTVSGNYKSYAIYTATGQLVAKGKARTQISLANVPQGVLVVKIDTGNGCQTMKVSR